YRLLGRRWTPELAPHAHVFLFTPDALRGLTQRGGFAVEADGAFQLALERPWALAARALGGDVRGAAWRGLQELGNVYARLIRRGPMQYVVGRVWP
ncbi:MAG: hypothetical protein KC656_29560, partial [Myxococcales bacterium]|nr:hypothetical protein [Myxococcales bacterium]